MRYPIPKGACAPFRVWAIDLSNHPGASAGEILVWAFPLRTRFWMCVRVSIRLRGRRSRGDRFLTTTTNQHKSRNYDLNEGPLRTRGDEPERSKEK